MIWIDNVAQVLTNTIAGTGDYAFDYGYHLYLGIDELFAYPFVGKISCFKLYGTAIEESVREADYQQNAWRRDPSTQTATIVYEAFPVPNEPV